MGIMRHVKGIPLMVCHVFAACNPYDIWLI